MEKCRPANVEELEVKAECFIVSQWRGLFLSGKLLPVLQKTVRCITDTRFLGLLDSSTKLISFTVDNPTTLHLYGWEK